ncbi:MAG: cytochrome b [Acidiferrobacterales bacterium]|nr:cytochrome b [Acidiferrobacterales bacterium]
MLKNSASNYGLVAILIHWLMATAIIATFALGLWMVELDYYSEWYKSAPDFHRSIGMIIAISLMLRFIWRLINVSPKAEPNIKNWEKKSALCVHYLLYFLVAIVTLTGYLISTADGRSVDVFGWFEVPATITSISNQADRAGELHYYLGIFLMVMASFHALAALKHHFLDKDKTLSRMLGKK